MRLDYHYRLTEHFSLNEFAVSASFPDIAAKTKFDPTGRLKSFYGCTTLLEPARAHFFPVKPLIITSGKCPVELNSLIPGRSPTSDHLWEGESWAVDFVLRGGNNFDCFLWMQNNLKYAFGQLIWHPVEKYIHVSLPTERHKYEVLEL